MNRFLILFLVVGLSVVVHESVHLVQIILSEDIEYTGWGIGIIEKDNIDKPLGFYWAIDTTISDRKVKLYEIQAYGIQLLFLIGALLRHKIKIRRGRKCVSS